MKSLLAMGFALGAVVAVLATPALSTPGRHGASTSLTSRVARLERQVHGLTARVNTLQQTAQSARATATRLDGCLDRALPTTRYGDYAGTDAGLVFTDYDPDVAGYVPTIVHGGWGVVGGLDSTGAGNPVDNYLAIVEPRCANGYFHVVHSTASHTRQR